MLHVCQSKECQHTQSCTLSQLSKKFKDKHFDELAENTFKMKDERVRDDEGDYGGDSSDDDGGDEEALLPPRAALTLWLGNLEKPNSEIEHVSEKQFSCMTHQQAVVFLAQAKHTIEKVAGFTQQVKTFLSNLPKDERTFLPVILA